MVWPSDGVDCLQQQSRGFRSYVLKMETRRGFDAKLRSGAWGLELRECARASYCVCVYEMPRDGLRELSEGRKKQKEKVKVRYGWDVRVRVLSCVLSCVLC